MKQYTLTLLVDEAQLLQAYISNQGISELDCPDTEEIVLSEMNWSCQNGIAISGDLLEDSDDQISITWSVDDILQQALTRNIQLSRENCQEILESIEDNYNADLGINWDIIDFAIDNYLY